jgi:putative NADPH-quinone reductase
MTKKRVLLINGHSDELSFNEAITDAYEAGAKASGLEIKRINLRDLEFDPILRHGYRVIQDLEPDLVKVQEMIKWADHLVFVFPVWWLGLPALMKGFVDRIFLPGFGYHYYKGLPFWKGLLKGKSARLFVTMDSPQVFNLFVYRSNGYTGFTNGVLRFCGLRHVRRDVFDLVRFSSPDKRQKWLKHVENRGRKGA